MMVLAPEKSKLLITATPELRAARFPNRVFKVKVDEV